MSDITMIKDQLDDDGELVITMGGEGLFNENEYFIDLIDLTMMAAVFGLELVPLHGVQ